MPLVTRTVAEIDTLPLDVQVAPVIALPPPEGVAEAAFELVATPLTVFLIQKKYVVPPLKPVAVKLRVPELTLPMRTRPLGLESVS